MDQGCESRHAFEEVVNVQVHFGHPRIDRRVGPPSGLNRRSAKLELRFMNTGLLRGPAATALRGADLSFYVGFAVAGVVYFALHKRESRRSRGMANPVAAEIAM